MVEEAQPNTAAIITAMMAIALFPHAIRIAPPVALDALIAEMPSLPDRRIELLGHIPKWLHALGITQVLPKSHFVRADPRDFPGAEEVAATEQITFVVGPSDLGDKTRSRFPDSLDDHLVDPNSCNTRGALPARPVGLPNEQRSKRISTTRWIVCVGSAGIGQLVLVDQGLAKRFRRLRHRSSGRRRLGRGLSRSD
ncbi:MAG: hypothetical protein ABI968_14875, partial [Acidobacteriota bacterium]